MPTRTTSDSGSLSPRCKTCGACHDTDSSKPTASTPPWAWTNSVSPARSHGRTWDTSPGAVWQMGPADLPLSLPRRRPAARPEHGRVVMSFGDRHVGGGPALNARDGQPLLELPADAGNPEAAALDPDGQGDGLGLAESGVVEMNCFLCHMPEPNNDARIAALQSGEFRWANTATLLGTGIVECGRPRAIAPMEPGRLRRGWRAQAGVRHRPGSQQRELRPVPRGGAHRRRDAACPGRCTTWTTVADTPPPGRSSPGSRSPNPA